MGETGEMGWHVAYDQTFNDIHVSTLHSKVFSNECPSDMLARLPAVAIYMVASPRSPVAIELWPDVLIMSATIS